METHSVTTYRSWIIRREATKSPVKIANQRMTKTEPTVRNSRNAAHAHVSRRSRYSRSSTRRLVGEVMSSGMLEMEHFSASLSSWKEGSSMFDNGSCSSDGIPLKSSFCLNSKNFIISRRVIVSSITADSIEYLSVTPDLWNEFLMLFRLSPFPLSMRRTSARLMSYQAPYSRYNSAHLSRRATHWRDAGRSYGPVNRSRILARSESMASIAAEINVARGRSPETIERICDAIVCISFKNAKRAYSLRSAVFGGRSTIPSAKKITPLKCFGIISKSNIVLFVKLCTSR